MENIPLTMLRWNTTIDEKIIVISSLLRIYDLDICP